MGCFLSLGRDGEGTGGELLVFGEGLAVEDPTVRASAATAASYDPADRYVLFELLINEVRANSYGDPPLPKPSRWRAP